MVAIYFLILLAVWAWLMYESMNFLNDPDEDIPPTNPKALMAGVFLMSFLGGLFWPVTLGWLVVEMVKQTKDENNVSD